MPRHLAYPLRLAGRTLATVEQDSPADIHGCCHAVLRHREGARWEDPRFGVPDQAFTDGTLAGSAVQRALARHEPRAVPGVSVDLARVAADAAVVVNVEA